MKPRILLYKNPLAGLATEGELGGRREVDNPRGCLVTQTSGELLEPGAKLDLMMMLASKPVPPTEPVSVSKGERWNNPTAAPSAPRQERETTTTKRLNRFLSLTTGC